MPERRTARENARLETGSQRGRNSHQTGVWGIYGLQGLSYGRSNFLYTGKSDLDASSQKLPTSGVACTRKHEEEPPEQEPPQPCTQVTATQISAKNQKFNHSNYLLRICRSSAPAFRATPATMQFITRNVADL